MKKNIIKGLDRFEKVSIDLIKMGTNKAKRKLGYMDFPERIRHRYREVHKPGTYEHLMDQEMYATDPLEKWQDDPNWRIKLDDKYNSREFAKMHGCKVPDLYWKGSNVDEIDFSSLPDRFVIKPKRGHSSVGTMVMDKYINLFDGNKYSPADIKLKLKVFLQTEQYFVRGVLGHERKFELGRQEFLIEEFIKNEDGEYEIPEDYKLFSFNGEVACIQVINRLQNEKGYTIFYDREWNPLPLITANYKKGVCKSPPNSFEEMVEKVNILGETYKRFVRIDFYATDKGAVFGEFTPTPAMGNGYTAYGVQLLNKYWDRYCVDEI